MARQAYSSEQSINSMTTRQLRQYIADKAGDAQDRLDSVNLSDTSGAFQRAAAQITKGKKVMRSTSNMSKLQMQDYAYKLQNFNALDFESGFEESMLYKQNKREYETFMDNQKDPYWTKFKNADGTPSQEGFEAYREYILFIRSLESVEAEYTYETVAKEARKALSKDPNRARTVSKLMMQVFLDSKGQGYTQAQLANAFKKKLRALDAEEAEKAKKRKEAAKKRKKASSAVKKAAKSTKAKTKRSSSKNEIKVKKAGKMRTDGTVRERLTT